MFTTNIKGTNIELTPDLKAYLEKRFSAFEKFIDKDDTSTVCDVELERSTKHQTGDVFRAEVTMHTRAGTFRAEEKGETPEAAIDAVKDEIQRELRRTKRKRDHLIRRGGARLKEFTRSFSEQGRRLRDFTFWRKRK